MLELGSQPYTNGTAMTRLAMAPGNLPKTSYICSHTHTTRKRQQQHDRCLKFCLCFSCLSCRRSFFGLLHDGHSVQSLNSRAYPCIAKWSKCISMSIPQRATEGANAPIAESSNSCCTFLLSSWPWQTAWLRQHATSHSKSLKATHLVMSRQCEEHAEGTKAANDSQLAWRLSHQHDRCIGTLVWLQIIIPWCSNIYKRVRSISIF